MKEMKAFAFSIIMLFNTAHADNLYRVHVRDFHLSTDGYFYCSMYVQNLTFQTVQVSGVETNFQTSNSWIAGDSVRTVYHVNSWSTNAGALWLNGQVRIVSAVHPFDSLFILPFEEKLFVTLRFNIDLEDPRKTIPERILFYIKENGDIVDVSAQTELIVGDLSSILSEQTTDPDEYILRQNYPNPFNPSTKITFTLPIRSEVDLSIYDLSGKRLLNLARGVYGSGTHTVDWNADGFSSGVYLYMLRTENTILSGSAVLLK